MRSRLVKLGETGEVGTVREGRITEVKVGKEYHLGWVLHSGRATRWVRVATIFILPKVADVLIYLRLRGAGLLRHAWEVLYLKIDPSQ